MLFCPMSALASNRGKRSRSNSSSSSSSSSAASSTGNSIFSRLPCADSASSLSNYSSPADSSAASPYTKEEEVDRPCKLLKVNNGSSSSSNITLDSLEKSASLDTVARFQSTELERPLLASCGRNYFVDCLVDAAVHMLDIIWYAPLSRSLAFVCEESPSSSSSIHNDIVRSTSCNVGRKISQQTIPLELFVRETLRRSKTSCSTLQAALLFCKRAGGEVIRCRAKEEGITLTPEQLEKLPGAASSYPSLFSASSESPHDSLLCNRRIFLASVMISSKFLQDRTYSNRAWSKISGLNVQELSRVERRLLMALEFDLNVREETWSSWTDFLKAQWKADRPIARSGLMYTKSASTAQVVFFRNNLVRTCSLPEGSGALGEEEIVDADVLLPSGDQQAFYASDPTLMLTTSPLPSEDSMSTGYSTPLSNPLDADMSTPTTSTKGTVSGDITPTASFVNRLGADISRKSGHGLLSTALLNHHLQACS